MLTNWKTTVLGVLLAALGAFAALDGVNTMSVKQMAIAFGACVLYAIKSAMTADAKQGSNSVVTKLEAAQKKDDAAGPSK